MGTNFYWKVPGIDPRNEVGKVELPTGVEYQVAVDVDDPRIHIGKRSAAGLYCWDCNVTLCEDGPEAIHQDTSGFHKVCPKCGAEADPENLVQSTAGLELGFGEVKPKRKTGVATCCSFTWAQDPKVARETCQKLSDEVVVTDEYGRNYKGGEFLSMLEWICPVHFTDSIGSHFS